MRSSGDRAALARYVPLVHSVVAPFSREKKLGDPLKEEEREELSCRLKRALILAGIESGALSDLMAVDIKKDQSLENAVRDEISGMGLLSYELADLAYLVGQAMPRKTTDEMRGRLQNLDFEDLQIARFFADRVLTIIRRYRRVSMGGENPGWEIFFGKIKSLLALETRRALKFKEGSRRAPTE